MNNKTETVEEFLARGGKIQKCSPAGFPTKGQPVRIRRKNDSRGEIYAVQTPRQSHVAVERPIDFSLLPDDLLDALAELIDG